MRKTHSLKGRKVFYSVHENIGETLVPAQNMITRHTRGCVTLQPTFLEYGFTVLWPPGSAEECPALFNTPPKKQPVFHKAARNIPEFKPVGTV